jgi:hypothetical protein
MKTSILDGHCSRKRACREGIKKPGPAGGLVPGKGKIYYFYYKLNLSIFQQVVLSFATPEGVAALATLFAQGVQV